MKTPAINPIKPKKFAIFNIEDESVVEVGSIEDVGHIFRIGLMFMVS